MVKIWYFFKFLHVIMQHGLQHQGQPAVIQSILESKYCENVIVTVQLLDIRYLRAYMLDRNLIRLNYLARPVAFCPCRDYSIKIKYSIQIHVLRKATCDRKK